jgi:hypothetical protein
MPAPSVAVSATREQRSPVTDVRHPPTTLRLEPQMIPVMRAAFDQALAELRP